MSVLTSEVVAKAVEFAANHEFTWAAIGVHPHDTKDGWGDVKTLLENKTENSPIVAIGEIGLDYYYNNSPRETQIEGLEAQLQMAIDYDLPVSFMFAMARRVSRQFGMIFGQFLTIFLDCAVFCIVLPIQRENLEKVFAKFVRWT